MSTATQKAPTPRPPLRTLVEALVEITRLKKRWANVCKVEVDRGGDERVA